MRPQTELRFIVGHDNVCGTAFKRAIEFQKAVAAAISTICGGCMVQHADGYWRDDGAEHKETFVGDLYREATTVFIVTCERDKVERTYRAIQQAIAVWADWYNLDAEWVQVQRTDIMGMHFQISKQPALTANGRIAYRDMVSPGTRGAHA